MKGKSGQTALQCFQILGLLAFIGFSIFAWKYFTDGSISYVGGGVFMAIFAFMGLMTALVSFVGELLLCDIWDEEKATKELVKGWNSELKKDIEEAISSEDKLDLAWAIETLEAYQKKGVKEATVILSRIEKNSK